MTQTFTSEVYYPQAPCLTRYSFSIISIFQSWRGFSDNADLRIAIHPDRIFP